MTAVQKTDKLFYFDDGNEEQDTKMVTKPVQQKNNIGAKHTKAISKNLLHNDQQIDYNNHESVEVFQPSYAKLSQLKNKRLKSSKKTYEKQNETRMPQLRKIEQQIIIKPKVLTQEYNQHGNFKISNEYEPIIKDQQPQQHKLKLHRSQHSRLRQLTSYDFRENRKFLITRSIEEGAILRCILKRERSGFLRFYPQYHLYFQDDVSHILSAKRISATSSSYIVSFSQTNIEANNQDNAASIESDFLGTQFQMFNKQGSTMCQVYYQSNLFAEKGPRRLDTFIPKSHELNVKNLKDLYQSGSKEITHLVNKQPVWNQQLNSYVLSFKGRANKTSVKNFILIDQQDEKCQPLLFGRAQQQIFNLDIQHPLSVLQAFCIALTSFNYKFACQ